MSYKPTHNAADPGVNDELERISQAINSLENFHLQVLYKPPEKTKVGRAVICDGVSWNPLGDGIKRPIWFDGSIWKRFTV